MHGLPRDSSPIPRPGSAGYGECRHTGGLLAAWLAYGWLGAGFVWLGFGLIGFMGVGSA